VVLSNDTMENHKVYLEDIRHLSGGMDLNIPMIADPNMDVSRTLGLVTRHPVDNHRDMYRDMHRDFHRDRECRDKSLDHDHVMHLER